jgi:hypothetical protein
VIDASVCLPDCGLTAFEGYVVLAALVIRRLDSLRSTSARALRRSTSEWRLQYQVHFCLLGHRVKFLLKERVYVFIAAIPIIKLFA